MATNKTAKIAEERTTEDYVLTQYHNTASRASFEEWKNKISEGDALYQGDLSGLFPDESALPDTPLVENKYKNALHDLSRLAAEGRGTVKFRTEGDRDRDMKRARVRESIATGYWGFNRMTRREHSMYLKLAGTGAMGASVYYDARSPYPQIHTLDPRFCYPDIRDGRIQTLTKIESVLERVLARQFPHLELDGSPDNNRYANFVCVYDDEFVNEAVLLSNAQQQFDRALVTKNWEHGLGCIPVGFETLDTFDGAFHGLFEQLKGPLMVRNKAMRFMVDLMEQMAHAPIFELGVENWDAEPGPLTVYHGDPTVENVQMTRVPPAAPAQSMWQLMSYMGDQEEKEAIQPPARAGNVSQSIASGSFVDRTQGQLTSVVKELQDKMSSLREQLNEICMKVEEKHQDFEKPLLQPVREKKMYTPSKDIAGWYFHEVVFGAGAGMDRINTDTRVYNALGARLVSRESARTQIDWLADSADEQDKIDRENLADVIFQRLVSDPTTPLPSIAPVWLSMKKDGDSFEEALEKHLPELLAAAAAAQAQVAGAPTAGAPLEAAPAEAVPGQEQPGQPGQTPSPEEQQLLDLVLQGPPNQQQFINNR